MKRYVISALCVLTAYLLIIGPFTRSMAQKPYTVRLGMIPHPKVLQVLFPDYQQLLGANTLGLVVQYFGTLADAPTASRKIESVADYPAMSRAIHVALRLDPYNMDGYYFGQSILVWDVGQYQLATDLLKYGMKYRTWDWQLPFFAAFNEVYFLKDRAAAVPLYMRAGELSGSTLFESLAGRYLQETGETKLAIDYLQTIQQSSRNPAIKKTLQLRIAAFKTVRMIEQARDRYVEKFNVTPANIEALLASGYLESRPVDPYGGEFFLDKAGRVETTSKFAFAGARRSAAETPATRASVPRPSNP